LFGISVCPQMYLQVVAIVVGKKSEPCLSYI
jgi:hypothetical protein